ncbi:MaoC family dehydratase [Bacillus salipaludis]|uniref:MaoC family dehydratase n=1 Tax=Bacillus salipaludis TaxID=2547811 RepID=A0ABW8RP45_9BACI
MLINKYYEDYTVGEEVITSGRTLTHADIRLFNGATDASHPAHVDAEYSKEHPFGKIVVPGALIIGVIDGFVVQNLFTRKTKIAHYGYDKIRFLSPVTPGDTIYMIAKVIEKRDKNEGFGIIKFEFDVKNQEQKTVAIVHDLQMVEKKGEN